MRSDIGVLSRDLMPCNLIAATCCRGNFVVIELLLSSAWLYKCSALRNNITPAHTTAISMSKEAKAISFLCSSLSALYLAMHFT